MSAGKKRHPIMLQQKATPPVKNSFGEDVTPFVDVMQVWADIKPPSARGMAGAKETILAGATVNSDLKEITIWTYPGVTDKWRVQNLEDSAYYDILAVRPSNDGMEMVLMARVGASNG